MTDKFASEAENAVPMRPLLESATLPSAIDEQSQGNLPGQWWSRRRLPHVLGASAAVTLILAYMLLPDIQAGVNQAFFTVQQLDVIQLREYLLSFGMWAPLVYFLIVVGQVIIAPIPAGPLMFAGTLMFGLVPGIVLSLVGSAIGSAILFAMARTWGVPLVMRFIGEATYHKYMGRIDAKGWWTLVIFLLPFMPDDAICALAGISTMSFRRFFVFMFIGRLPGIAMTAFLAVGLVDGTMTMWLVGGGVLAVLFGLMLLCRKRLESYLNRPTA